MKRSQGIAGLMWVQLFRYNTQAFFGGAYSSSSRFSHKISHTPMPIPTSSSSWRLFSSATEDGTERPTTTNKGRVSNAVQDSNLLQKTTTQSSSTTSSTKLDTNPPKGTRDFYPEDMRLRTWLFDQWRKVAASYGFSEYDAPVLESEVHPQGGRGGYTTIVQLCR